METPDTGNPQNLLAGYLSEDDLARELGVNIRTLRAWKAQGTAPPITPLGKKILYKRDSVLEWLASREVRRRAGRR